MQERNWPKKLRTAVLLFLIIPIAFLSFYSTAKRYSAQSDPILVEGTVVADDSSGRSPASKGKSRGIGKELSYKEYDDDPDVPEASASLQPRAEPVQAVVEANPLAFEVAESAEPQVAAPKPLEDPRYEWSGDSYEEAAPPSGWGIGGFWLKGARGGGGGWGGTPVDPNPHLTKRLDEVTIGQSAASRGFGSQGSQLFIVVGATSASLPLTGSFGGRMSLGIVAK